MARYRMSRRVVQFHYTLRDSTGQVIDLSAGGEPVQYLEGAGQIIDGLDEQMRSLAPGTKARISVPSARAYGPKDQSLVHHVSRSVIPVEGDLQVGDRFQTEADPGSPVVTIAAIDGDTVTLDANHPLAGVDLIFDVEVIAAREAGPDELAHGHAHGAGACDQEGGCGCHPQS